MKRMETTIGGVPAWILGEDAPRAFLFVHGKQGSKADALPYAEAVCPKGWQVLAVDLPEHGDRKDDPTPLVPWVAAPEIARAMDYARGRWAHVGLIAVSLGAYMSMRALWQEPPECALFVSPILDMDRLITTMMGWAGVTQAELEARGEIPTAFGETLSIAYQRDVRSHPVEAWTAPTSILYAGGDHLTPRGVVDTFAAAHGALVTVMEDGEHWFHTPEQMAALRAWLDGAMDAGWELVRVSERPELAPDAAQWFHEKWGIPLEAYRESMTQSIAQPDGVPFWLLALDAGRIVGGLGVIDNDFHKRPDLTPNLCAVYVDPAYRRRGLARALLDAACARLAGLGITDAYLITTHTAFYERCGWTFLGMVEENDGGMARMYHKTC